ncbi:flagellar hook-length control protein FliK [Candidatus Nitrotoga arctica]|uniref:Flagellar hook-length control protein fliK n=1 Tax=Candidatus Nitrotoga arctica TaxID=453162 RepID=A0ABN8APK3_9PROT|nr:flagellar hook-length control protein FliK [Candidatus Nitrotoga arctica]CAG9932663.1 Flagellar hook-length control protein fliK [Candidatus Nitrotoga arctica]
MQNIIIPVTSPAVAAHTSPVVADDGTLPTETFGNVLARQLADSAQPTKTNTPDTRLPALSTTENILSATSSPATDTILTATSSNEQSIEPQAPTLDSLSALPNDMLAALLPSNLAPQISISRAQPTQSEALSRNRAQSIATSKMSFGYDTPATPATTLEILNSGHSSKSMTLLADAQLTTELSNQASAPQPDATTLVALQAPVSNVTHLNSPISLSVNMPVTHKAWADEFSQKIVWVATQHGQSAELHLNPPQLGPVDVLIKVDGGQATAIFTSAHAVVRDAIEQALPKLREMLADNGIMLSNATVSDQSPREQQTKQTDQQHRRESRQAKIDDAILVSSTQVRSGRYQQGSVDTFA